MWQLRHHHHVELVTVLTRGLDGAGLIFFGGEQEQKTKVLKINVDLMLYRARGYSQQAYMAKNVVRRKQLFDRAEAAFRRCLEWDLADGRAYVGLGKVLVRSKRPEEARSLFEEGTRMVGMENPYIWQVRVWHVCGCSLVHEGAAFICSHVS